MGSGNGHLAKFISGITKTKVITIDPLEEDFLGNTEAKSDYKDVDAYLKTNEIGDIDYLVLGCTHYPYLIPILEKMLPKKVTIIDSGLAVAKQTQAILKANDLLNSNMTKPLIKLYSNRDIVVLNSILNNRFDTSFLEF